MPTVYLDKEAFDILTKMQDEIKIAYSEASLSTAVRYQPVTTFALRLAMLQAGYDLEITEIDILVRESICRDA
jgi:hypothetical protein